MKVLLVNQYFYPDVAATAQFITELAEDLAELGVEVHVLRGTASYDAVINRRAPRKEAFKKVTIHKSPALNVEGNGILSHLLNYSMFNTTAPLRTLTLPRFDAVIAFTTPPLIGLTGVVCKMLKGTCFVQVIADLYPDVAIKLGYLNQGSWITSKAEQLTKFMLNQADYILVKGQCMREQVQTKKLRDPGKVLIVRDWADKNQIYPVPAEDNWFLKEQSLEDKFVVQYSGHIGEGHDFSAVLESAKLLKSYEDIQFLFIGGGPGKKALQEAKKRSNLTNIRFLPYQDKGDLPYTLSAADISLVTLKEGLEGLIVPSKIYGILASGRPVIYVGNPRSEIAHIIENGKCGFVFSLNESKKLAKTILELYHHRNWARNLGRKARNYFLDNFERSKSTKRYYNLLHNLVSS